MMANNHDSLLVDCDLQGSAKAWAELEKLPMRVEHMPIETDAQVAPWSRAVRSIKADYVLLDSPPHLNAVLGGVIGISDLVVVPRLPARPFLCAAFQQCSRTILPQQTKPVVFIASASFK